MAVPGYLLANKCSINADQSNQRRGGPFLMVTPTLRSIIIIIIIVVIMIIAQFYAILKLASRTVEEIEEKLTVREADVWPIT